MRLGHTPAHAFCPSGSTLYAAYIAASLYLRKLSFSLMVPVTCCGFSGESPHVLDHVRYFLHAFPHASPGLTPHVFVGKTKQKPRMVLHHVVPFPLWKKKSLLSRAQLSPAWLPSSQEGPSPKDLVCMEDGFVYFTSFS